MAVKCPFIIVYGNNNFLHFLHIVNKVLKKYVFVKDVISNKIPFKDGFTCFSILFFYLSKNAFNDCLSIVITRKL